VKKIASFVISDILRNKVILVYTLVLAVFSWSIFSLEDSTSKAVLSLLNLVLLTVPLVAIIFSNIYIYNSGEFIELLVSQPVKRASIWTALFAGLSSALVVSFLVGIGIPVVIFIPGKTGLILVATGIMVTLVFTSLAMLCSILMRDKARGIGLSVIIWLFMTLIYDGLVLFLMFQFADYPIEKPMVVVSALNPIDLARILVLLQIDMTVLLGFTGAVFQKMFGTTTGLAVSAILMMLWILIPFYLSLKIFKRKDL